jgi:hypothetical protein
MEYTFSLYKMMGIYDRAKLFESPFLVYFIYNKHMLDVKGPTL